MEPELPRLLQISEWKAHDGGILSMTVRFCADCWSAFAAFCAEYVRSRRRSLALAFVQMVDSDLIEEPVLVTTSLDKVVRIWGLVGNFQGSLLHGPFSVRGAGQVSSD